MQDALDTISTEKKNFKAYQNQTKEPLQWDTFTTDFEKPLINAFHLIFNTAILVHIF